MPGKKLCGQDSAQNLGDFSPWENQYLNNLPKADPAQASGLVSPEKGPVLSGRPFLTGTVV